MLPITGNLLPGRKLPVDQPPLGGSRSTRSDLVFPLRLAAETALPSSSILSSRSRFRP
jgi:hypothetical protein